MMFVLGWYMSFTLISCESNFPDFRDLWTESGGELLKICDSNAWLVPKQLTTAKEVSKVSFDKICPVCQQEFYKTSTKRWSPFQVEHFFLEESFFRCSDKQPLSRIVKLISWPPTTLSHTTIPVLPRDHRCLPCCWKILSLGYPFIPHRKFFSQGSARDKLVISSFPNKSTGG